MLVNIDHIIGLTGSTRRTILRKLGDLKPVDGPARSKMYESKDALPILYGQHTSPSGKKTLESERTRLATSQAEKMEMEVEVMKGNLLPADEYQEKLETMISAFKSRMLGLPIKAAATVVTLTDEREAEVVIRDYVYEALSELSGYEAHKSSRKDDKPGRKGRGTTTSTNNKPVGRQGKKTKQ